MKPAHSPAPKLSPRRSPAGPLLVALAVTPTTLLSLGVRIPNQDAEAIARGNAFVATANNPSAIYYNPAGITQLPGHNLQAGLLNYFGINSHYESANPAFGNSDTEFKMEPVPQLHYTYGFDNNRLALGLGAYAPYGLGTEWPEDTGFRSLALEARINYFTLNPVLAVKPHPTLSLAVGPTFNYSDISLERGLSSPTDRFQFEGDDFAYGFNAGLLWQPHPKWSFGASYRSATTLDYEGSSEYKDPVQNPCLFCTAVRSDNSAAQFDYPQHVVFGISFRPTPNWNLEFNVDWTDWDTLNTVTLENTALLGMSLPFPLCWESSFFYEFGVTRSFNNGYHLSAGYFFSQNSVPDKYFTPFVPDTDLHTGSIGVGYKGPHWRWALASQLIATAGSRQVKGSQPSLLDESADGDYRFLIPTVAASVGYHF